MKLKEQFLACATEYARQFGDIIGVERDMWIGPVEGHCALFSDYSAYTLEEMAVVVDSIDHWSRKLGGKDIVGKTAREWNMWATGSTEAGEHPKINLCSWLRGLRPKDIKVKMKNEG